MRKGGSLLSQATQPAHISTSKTVAGVTRVPCRHITYRALRKWQTSRSQWPSNSQLAQEADEGDHVLADHAAKFGRNSELNWGLHKYRIAPAHDAYRNLHLGGLVMHANGTIDAKKALHVPLSENDDKYNTYYGEKAPSYSKGAQVLNLQHYKEIVRQVKEHLCDVPRLYVHDGAVGSHTHCETRVRVITDSPASGIYLHHLLSKVSTRGPAQEFAHALTAYVVPHFKIADPKAVGLKDDSGFVLLDVPRGIAFVVGTPSTTAVRTALTAIASPRVFVDREAVPLHANIVHVGSQSKPLLVISPDNAVLKMKLNLGGGHSVAWGAKGVYRFFDGVSVPHHENIQLKKGDLVEKDGKGNPVRTTSRGSGHNAYEHPSAIVLVVSDASGVLPAVSKVSPGHIKNFFLSGPTGDKTTPFRPLFAQEGGVVADPHGVSDRVAELAKQNKVDVYIVNAHAKGTPLTHDEVTDILTAIGAGSATNASGLANVFSNLLPITALHGVKATIDPTKRGWSAADYKTAAATFEKSLENFVSTNFPAQPAAGQQ